MDNWEKYIQDNEENFSIEEVDDKVWKNVYKAGVPKKRFFIKRIKIALEGLFKKWEIGKERYTAKRRYSKLKLAYASIFVAFIVFSCTYKVKSYSKYGDMVTFALAKSSYLVVNEHSKSLFNSFSSIISPKDSSSILFLRFIKKNDPETKKIIGNLKVTAGISDLAITPVEFEFKESLFSSLVNKAFEVQISKVTPDDRQIKNKIKDVLKEKGLGSLNIQIDDKSRDVLFSPEIVDQKSLMVNAIDSLIIANDIIDKVKVTSKTDTTNPNTGLKNLSGWKQDHALMTELTKALEKDGLVDNRKPYKLEVKDGELYINDKKQSKELSDKYRKFFIKDNYTLTSDGAQPKPNLNYNDAPKDVSKTVLPNGNNNIPKWDPEQWKREMKLMNLLIDGLVKEGLINRNGPYTVQIKDGELIINNQKQPKEISDKMRPFFASNNYGFMND